MRREESTLPQVRNDIFCMDRWWSKLNFKYAQCTDIIQIQNSYKYIIIYVCINVLYSFLILCPRAFHSVQCSYAK